MKPIIEKNNIVVIWPMVIEKAMAKMYATYECLEDSQSLFCDSYKELTGQPFLELTVSHQNFADYNPQYTIYTYKDGSIRHPEYSPSHPSSEPRSVMLTYNYPASVTAKIVDIECEMFVKVFVLEKASSVMLDLSQIDRRFACNKTKYAVIRLMLLSGEWEKPVLIDGLYGVRKTIAVRANLNPGKYYIYVDSSWPAKKGDLVLNLFHEGNESIELQSFDSQGIPQLLSGLYQTQIPENKLVINRYISERTGLIIEKIGNGLSSPTHVSRTLDSIKTMGLELLFSESWNINEQLKPNEELVVVIRALQQKILDYQLQSVHQDW